MLLRVAAFAVFVIHAYAEPPKLFIEPRRVKSRDIALEMTRELMRSCPASVVITKNADGAELRLATTPGATTLYRADGSVEKIFGTKYLVSRLGREVCAYLKAR